MKTFIKHIGIFICILLLSGICFLYMADGSTDTAYLRFTTPKKSSLIVGSSRAAQAFQPRILNQELINSNFFNYSFTELHSPYGEAYYSSISRKLNMESFDGRFIVTVDPWVISSKTTNPNDSLNFRELGSYIDKVNLVNYHPNLEYLIESFSERRIKILTNKGRVGEYETAILHKDGWLEVDLHMDSLGLAALKKNKMEAYREKLREYSGFSSVRLRYLNKIIELFKSHGRVYLVRIPVCNDMQEMENELMPDFNEIMEALATDHSIKYLNMMDDWQSYSYTDGHHLERMSGAEFSKTVARIIQDFEIE